MKFKLIGKIAFGILIFLIGLKVGMTIRDNQLIVHKKNGSIEISGMVNEDKSAQIKTIQQFYQYINNGQTDKATDMINELNFNKRQMWIEEFEAIKSVNIMDIQPAGVDTYKVKLEAYVSAKSSYLPTPFYGWHDNPNYRVITLIKGKNNWMINTVEIGQ